MEGGGRRKISISLVNSRSFVRCEVLRKLVFISSDFGIEEKKIQLWQV